MKDSIGIFKKSGFYILISFPALIMFSCGGDDSESEPVPQTGIVSGNISNASNDAPLADVQIFVFNADNNASTGVFGQSDADGNYSFEMPGGNYYLKLSKQGFYNVPQRGVSALPFTIINGQTIDNPVKMYPNEDTDIGIISGTVKNSSGEPVEGVLVVASSDSTGYSSLSNSDGIYSIFNVKSGNYSVKGWKASYNSDMKSVSVSQGAETENTNLTLEQNAQAQVSGQITFLATGNIEVDVALTIPETQETVPGLSTYTVNGNYLIEQVPDGTFLARATYSNDGKVIDPDWIVKNGEPFVTINGGNETRDFSVTGSVNINDPSNPDNLAVPVQISNTSPTFSWESYPSTSDYIIELRDASGNLIWGGFNDDYTIRNIVIPSSQTSISFNSDGNAAVAQLEVGRVYRWRIFASKDASGGSGWNLISASEDQKGLIQIIE